MVSSLDSLQKQRFLAATTIVLGIVEGVLIARFVLRLFAARPDNPTVQALYLITQPVIAPLHALDAGQPQYGASLEYATLTLLLVLPLITTLIWRWIGNRLPGA